MGDGGFVCALRKAFGQLSRVPISGTRVVRARVQSTTYPAVSQFDGVCAASTRRLSGLQDRRMQALSQISFDVEVDAALTALASAASVSVEFAVRSAVEAAFMLNSSLIDSVFLAVTLAACSAQGIAAQVCPNPPSLALTLSSRVAAASSIPEPLGTVPAVAGAVAGLFVVFLISAFLWRRRAKASRDGTKVPSPDLTIRSVTSGPHRAHVIV
jgi:hypothetical protein